MCSARVVTVRQQPLNESERFATPDLLPLPQHSHQPTVVHRALFAIREVARADQGSEPDRVWLKAEVKDYRSYRNTLIVSPQYLTPFQHTLPGWNLDTNAAELPARGLENDH